MKQIDSQNLFEEYWEQYHFDQFFGFNIRPYTSLLAFDPEDIILQEGTKSNHLYFLLNGRAKVFITHKNGTVTLVNFLESPCFIGEMEMVNDQSACHGVTALRACLCFSIDLSCKAQLLHDIVFLQNLCKFLSRKTLSDVQNYSRNQAYPMKTKLASFILLTANNGLYRERHTETASYLGVTYRHLLYVLAEFVKDGILEKTPHGYRIVMEEELKQIADGDI